MPPEHIYMDANEVVANCQQYSGINIIHQPDVASWRAATNDNKQFPVEARNEKPYQTLLAHLHSSNNKILIVTETPGRKEALEGVLLNNALRPTSYQGYMTFSPINTPRWDWQFTLSNVDLPHILITLKLYARASYMATRFITVGGVARSPATPSQS